MQIWPLAEAGPVTGTDFGDTGAPGDELEGKGPQRRPQRWLDWRLEEVAKAVGGGYCQLQMPLKLALAIRETVDGRRLGALEGEGGGGFQCIPGVHVATIKKRFSPATTLGVVGFVKTVGKSGFEIMD